MLCALCLRFDEVKAKVYERLLRKLLHWPSRPAVVLLQLMPKGMAYKATRCVAVLGVQLCLSVCGGGRGGSREGC
jgi:hypothetical protein